MGVLARHCGPYPLVTYSGTLLEPSELSLVSSLFSFYFLYRFLKTRASRLRVCLLHRPSCGFVGEIHSSRSTSWSSWSLPSSLFTSWPTRHRDVGDGPAEHRLGSADFCLPGKAICHVRNLVDNHFRWVPPSGHAPPRTAGRRFPLGAGYECSRRWLGVDRRPGCGGVWNDHRFGASARHHRQCAAIFQSFQHSRTCQRQLSTRSSRKPVPAELSPRIGSSSL